MNKEKDKKLFPIAHKAPLGTSTEALADTDNSPSVQAEKAKEIMFKFINALSSKKGDVTPFVIGMKNGIPVIQECIVDENGNITLPDIKMNTKQDLKKKSRFVKNILEVIKPVLHTDIENVTYIALMRKDAEKLGEMMMELKNSEGDVSRKAKLENRAGCIWLCIGEYEVVL